MISHREKNAFKKETRHSLKEQHKNVQRNHIFRLKQNVGLYLGGGYYQKEICDRDLAVGLISGGHCYRNFMVV